VSWIPGGRLGQSIYRTGDSPITGIQNFTGFPLTGIQRYQKKLEKLFPDKEGENLEKVDEKTSK